MEVVEGGIGDETSQMSIDMERASDLDSAAQPDDLQRSLHPSRLGKPSFDSYDRLLTLVRSLLESGYWDHALPSYEKQVLLVATSSPSSWEHFLDSTAIPSSAALSSNAYTSSSSTTSVSTPRRAAAAAATKAQKPVTRSRRGTSTPRRRGADADNTESNAADSTQDSQHASREHIETLHTRLRTLIFDTLVDEILFPHERHLELVPVSNSIKQAFGLPREPVEMEPFFTFEDLKEVREGLLETPEKESAVEYSIPSITNMVTGIEPPPSAPATPGGASESRSRSKRKLPHSKREVRNLYTDSKATRKWERLELIGASPEYRDFVREMESALQVLKDAKPHSVPFMKPLKDSDAPDYKDAVESPMDLSTVARNLDNMMYWTKASFAQDLDLIFQNARAYYTSPESAPIIANADELEALAKQQLENMTDADFTHEKEALRDTLANIIPDAHGQGDGGDASSTSPDTPYDPVAEAIKRAHFFKEDPTVTNWRSAIKARLDSGSEMNTDGNGDADSTTSTTCPNLSPGTLPDPLFELPKAEYLQGQWRSTGSQIYSSIAPEVPMIRAPLIAPLANPATVLPECSAQRVVAQLTHRHAVLLQRVKDHTAAKGMSPLDPKIERPIPPPESSSNSNSSSNEPRIHLFEPTIKLVMPPPPSATPATAAPPTSGSPAPTANGAPGTTGGKTPSKMAGSLGKIDPALGDEDEEEAPTGPVIPPFFSEGNSVLSDPIDDDIPSKHDPSTLASAVLDEETVEELMKQAIGVQLALTGFQGAHDTALNVMTDVLASFISRIGFLATTHLSTPGTLLSLQEIMSNAMSDVFPRGIQSVKSFAIAETLKSDNCLRIVDPATMLGWLETSPTLSKHLTPPQPSSKLATKQVQDPQKAIVDSIMAHLGREEKLDEKTMTLGESREFYLQQAPFAKRTSSYYHYKPLAYVGSTSSVAVGTPSGLHHVLPPGVHTLDPAAKAAAAAQAAAAAAAVAHSNTPHGAIPHGHHPHVMPEGQDPAAAHQHRQQQMHLQQQQQHHHQQQQQQQQQRHQAMQMQQQQQQQQGGGAMSPHMQAGMPPGSLPPNAMMNRTYPGMAPGSMPPNTTIGPSGEHVRTAPPPGAPKKHMPGTIGYPPPHAQGMPAGYAPPPGNPGQPRAVYPPGAQMNAHPNYMHGQPPMANPQAAGVPIPGKKTGASPKFPPTQPQAIPNELAQRGSSAKRKRPQTAGTPVAAEPEEDAAAEGEGRRTRSRRGNTAAFGDEYYYDEEIDDGDDGEPKRKKRKAPASSSKR